MINKILYYLTVIINANFDNNSNNYLYELIKKYEINIDKDTCIHRKILYNLIIIFLILFSKELNSRLHACKSEFA